MDPREVMVRNPSITLSRAVKIDFQELQARDVGWASGTTAVSRGAMGTPRVTAPFLVPPPVLRGSSVNEGHVSRSVAAETVGGNGLPG